MNSNTNRALGNLAFWQLSIGFPYLVWWGLWHARQQEATLQMHFLLLGNQENDRINLTEPDALFFR